MRIAGLVAGLCLPYAAGALLAWRLWPTRAKPVLMLAIFAWPAGLALTSSFYFLWMVVSGGRATWVPWLEVAALALASLMALRRGRMRRERPAWPARPRPGLSALAWLVLLAAAGTSLVLTLRFAALAPWGYWDAWARINLKARFLYAGGDQWTWIFHGELLSHGDYPLLVKASVARLWSWSGGIDPLPPQVLSISAWVACLAALLALVGTLRSSLVTVAAGLAFLCKTSDPWWAAMQYADFALATYFVWSAGFLALASRHPGRAELWWPLFGFSAASAAWCKNEGLAFAGLASAAALWLTFRAVPATRRWRATAALGGGLLLGGFSVLVLKFGFAGQSSVFGTRSRSLVADLTDPSRYHVLRVFLGGHLREEVLGWALALLALALLLLPRRSEVRRSWLPLAVWAATTLVFALVLVTTREDLTWHVSTTIDRLVLQLWPLAILGVALGLRSAG